MKKFFKKKNLRKESKFTIVIHPSTKRIICTKCFFLSFEDGCKDKRKQEKRKGRKKLSKENFFLKPL